jgi:hypothetical protein
MKQWDERQMKILTDRGLDKTQARIVINNFVDNNPLSFTNEVPQVNVIKDVESEK